MFSVSKVRSVIEKIIRLQDELARLVDRDLYEEFKEEVEREPERVGVLEIRDRSGSERVIIALQQGRARIVDNPDKIDHVVKMDLDTFVDLITGELDLGEAWALDLVEVEGEDSMLHLIRWVKWFRVMREALKKVIKSE